eukprot:750445-Hanusia_phi.AAC.1
MRDGLDPVNFEAPANFSSSSSAQFFSSPDAPPEWALRSSAGLTPQHETFPSSSSLPQDSWTRPTWSSPSPSLPSHVEVLMSDRQASSSG